MGDKKIVWKDIAQLDCRDEKERKALQDCLKCIKPLRKYKDQDVDVPFDKLEKAIHVISKKYRVCVQHIKSDCHSNDDSIIWSGEVVDERDLSHYTMYGLSMYELLAKVVVTMYFIREQVGER